MKKLLNIFHLISNFLGIMTYDSFLQLSSPYGVSKEKMTKSLDVSCKSQGYNLYFLKSDCKGL